jgi:hypothetical protein
MSEEFDDECLMLNESLELANEEIERLKKQSEILQGALTAVYVFWKDIDTPKPYFIGDTCEKALREVEGME